MRTIDPPFRLRHVEKCLKSPPKEVRAGKVPTPKTITNPTKPPHRIGAPVFHLPLPKAPGQYFGICFEFILKKWFLTAKFCPKSNPLLVTKGLLAVCLPLQDDNYRNQIRITGMQRMRGIINLRGLIQLIMAKLILMIITISEQVNGRAYLIEQHYHWKAAFSLLLF